MRLLMLLALLVLVASVGCTSAPAISDPVLQTVDVMIPVRVPCIEVMPARPAVGTVADILALRNAEAALALMVQHNLLLAYVGELEAVAAACIQE